MEYKSISGRKIPVLGIGTWGIGGKFEAEPAPILRKQWVSSMQEAIKLGMTHIDTAEIYAQGTTEEIVGEAIKPFSREDLFITGKVWRDNLRHDDVIKSVKKSLERLGTKYLDLCLVHWPNLDIPIAETMKALEELQKSGLVRNIGVSNFSTEQIREAQGLLKTSKLNAVENEYNLLNRDDDVLRLCDNEGMLLIAYRPLARGSLAKPGIPILDKIATKYGKTQPQVALNWLISKKPVITIPKAASKEHILENLGSIGWKMSTEDYKALDKLSPVQKPDS